MSAETWLKEFYPIKAQEVPVAEAAAHSLQKWKGLRPANLTKHGCDLRFGDVQCGDDYVLGIHAGSCALCWHHINYDSDPCSACPLYVALGGHRCAEDDNFPYESFLKTDDPEPMITALEKAVANEKETP